MIGNCVEDQSVGFRFWGWGFGHVDDVLFGAGLAYDAEFSALDEFNHVGGVHE